MEIGLDKILEQADALHFVLMIAVLNLWRAKAACEEGRIHDLKEFMSFTLSIDKHVEELPNEDD